MLMNILAYVIKDRSKVDCSTPELCWPLAAVVRSTWHGDDGYRAALDALLRDEVGRLVHQCYHTLLNTARPMQSSTRIAAAYASSLDKAGMCIHDITDLYFCTGSSVQVLKRCSHLDS